MAERLGRRAFIIGLPTLVLAACMGGCGTGPSPKEPTLPNVAELLSLEAANLIRWLHVSGYSYNKSADEFTVPGTYAGRDGRIALIVLGEENGPTGRRLSPDRLDAGTQPQAITATLFLTSLDGGPNLSGADARTAINRELNRGSLASNDLIGMYIGEGEAGGTASFAGASCNVNNREALWACTIVSGRGITVCCSYLDYYASSMGIENSYDAVAATLGPWDISTDRSSHQRH